MQLPLLTNAQDSLDNLISCEGLKGKFIRLTVFKTWAQFHRASERKILLSKRESARSNTLHDNLAGILFLLSTNLSFLSKFVCLANK